MPPKIYAAIAFLLPFFLLSACAGGGRVEVLTRAPSFHARTLALAAVHGGAGKGAALSRALVERLRKAGVRLLSLENSDSVLAGAALDLGAASDPSVLAEIRRATAADGVVFLSFDANGRDLDVTVLNLVTGDVALRAAVHPRDATFASADDAAAAAADALSLLSLERGGSSALSEGEISPP